MHENLGDRLIGLAQRAENSALIAAPFIKATALQRVSDVLPSGVPLTVITRWAPEEIVSGASDLEVWGIVKNRSGARLRLLPGLHAKYFSFDGTVALGSANITNRALGWSKEPNLELLVEMPRDDFAEFEAVMLSRSFEVDDDAHAAMRSAVAALAACSEVVATPTTDFEDASVVASWFPRSLQVQRLFACYGGRRDQVIKSVFEDGMSDLSALQPPEGLEEATFNAFVAARLQQVPVVAAIDAAAIKALDRTAGAGLLVALGETSEEDSTIAWDTISAWLLHFFPDRYRQKATFTGPALERSQVIR